MQTGLGGSSLFERIVALSDAEDPEGLTNLLKERGNEIDVNFFLNPAHNWGRVSPMFLVFIRAIVGENVFTPQVMERLRRDCLNVPDFVFNLLPLNDTSMMVYIRTAQSGAIPGLEAIEVLFALGKSFRAEWRARK